MTLFIHVRRAFNIFPSFRKKSYTNRTIKYFFEMVHVNGRISGLMHSIMTIHQKAHVREGYRGETDN